MRHCCGGEGLHHNNAEEQLGSKVFGNSCIQPKIYIYTFFFLSCLWWNRSPYCLYSPMPPLRGQPTVQWSAIPDGSPSKDWQSTVGWGDYWIWTQDCSFTIWCHYQWATTAPKPPTPEPPLLPEPPLCTSTQKHAYLCKYTNTPMLKSGKTWPLLSWVCIMRKKLTQSPFFFLVFSQVLWTTEYKVDSSVPQKIK